MNEIIFKISFVALFIVYVLIRVPFAKIHQKEEILNRIHAAREKFMVFLMSIGLLLMPMLWLFTTWLDDFSMEFPVWLRFAGVALAGGSLFYFQWIHQTLGANWSPTLEIRKGHQLIKSGPYKNIRHPMYAQIWLWTIAQCLMISNYIAGFTGIMAWAVLYFIRINQEEKLMIDKFGAEYEEYMKQTGRVFPKFNRNY